jgi:hypothetical protein
LNTRSGSCHDCVVHKNNKNKETESRIEDEQNRGCFLGYRSDAFERRFNEERKFFERADAYRSERRRKE